MRKNSWMTHGLGLAMVVAVVLGPVLGLTASVAAAQEISMTTGRGDTMTLTMKALPDSRGYIYCELLFQYDSGIDVYSTSPLAPCSLEWWENLDLDALAEEFGAEAVLKNGPQFWASDEVRLMLSERVPVAGIDMVFGARLPPGTEEVAPYAVFLPAKYHYLAYEAGKPVYQLVDPEGHVYVAQAHKLPVDEMASLGDRL